MDQKLTLPEIARRLGEPLHRVRYAVETYRIEPSERIGIMRVWGEAQVAAIQSALRRIAQGRGNYGR